MEKHRAGENSFQKNSYQHFTPEDPLKIPKNIKSKNKLCPDTMHSNLNKHDEFFEKDFFLQNEKHVKSPRTLQKRQKRERRSQQKLSAKNYSLDLIK